MNWRDLLSWNAGSAQPAMALPSNDASESVEEHALNSKTDSAVSQHSDISTSLAADVATTSQDTMQTNEKAQVSDPSLENVVNLQSRIRPSPHEYRNYSASPVPSEENDDNGFRGIFDDAMLKTFFAQNFWGFGNYDGAHYKSTQAMELGKNAITARFQNTLSAILSRKKAQLTKLQATVIETEGVCPMTTAQLKLACQHVEADIATIAEQLDAAGMGTGWVRDALNRYQIGFAKGLRDTIPFERLL